MEVEVTGGSLEKLSRKFKKRENLARTSERGPSKKNYDSRWCRVAYLYQFWNGWCQENKKLTSFSSPLWSPASVSECRIHFAFRMREPMTAESHTSS
jgi:hypothetical protein